MRWRGNLCQQRALSRQPVLANIQQPTSNIRGRMVYMECIGSPQGTLSRVPATHSRSYQQFRYVQKEDGAMLSRSLSLCLILASCVSAVYAQYTTASLGGTVLDPGAAAVPGSTVKVENMDTGLVQTTTTGTSGQFVFTTL